jgi:hypothetical protein
MPTNPFPENTDFSRDVLGRYICNGLDEALASTNNAARPDAREFDIIILGGGTFGSTVAQELFTNDLTHNHRILVLEGGSFVIPEHVQNMPTLGLFNDGAVLENGQPKTITNLRDIGQDTVARKEVWGLAWHSPIGFPGLAYCLGGRSLYWGGWSPRLLDAEMPGSHWPATVVSDLKNQYFDEAAEQIGVDVSNDFIHGPLHDAVRQQLLDGIKSGDVSHVVPLSELPLTLKVPSGTSTTQQELLKLEAPLGVQSTPPRPGYFPFNKFSAIQLLMKAARAASIESNLDDFKKRLMVVPNCHVIRLFTQGTRVSQILTNQGPVTVPLEGKVIIALGTIESNRLALLSFQGIPNYGLIGKDFMAHLRSNFDIRVPREALQHLSPNVKELQTSALLVKGRFSRNDGSVGHFHQQITASGLGFRDANSEAELFRKVPDIDEFDVFKNADDGTIVITIRGIGEMVPDNPLSSVQLHGEPDEYGVQRAAVSIAADARDIELWNAMDENAQNIANVLADGQPFEVVGAFRRDGLGSTHHECGGLQTGDDSGSSVTNTNGRFWHVDNAYVAGPALFPTIGSPNPMLTGVALTRRLADHLVPKPVTAAAEPDFNLIFDGLSANRWRISTIQNQPPNRSDPGNGAILGGALEMAPGNDLGLFWYTRPMPPDFILRLEWRRLRHEDNSGVFVRFPHPDSKSYNNTAFVGVDFGFEVQIDELGQPDGLGIHRTGAIYNQPGQTLTLQPAKPAGEWNEFEISVQGQTYMVFLNGVQVTAFTNTDPNRGLPSTPAAPSFIGLQTYPGSRVAYRNIRYKSL